MSKNIAVSLIAFLVLGSSQLAEAQQPKKVPLMGYLTNRTGRDSANAEALRQGLKGLAYVEGQNIAIELRSSEGNYDRLTALAAELVQRKVDIIFAAGAAAGAAAKNATRSIPIIFVAATDPVTTGLVASLARPGGNVTGFSMGTPG